MSLTVKAAPLPSGTLLTLKGGLNADAATPLAQLQIGAGELVFDFEGVSFCSSQGIREWLLFLARLPVEVAKRYQNCQPPFVDAFNMVPLLKQGIRVESAWLPAHCDYCAAERRALLQLQRDLDDQGSLTRTLPCEKCGQGLSPLVPLQEYFRFYLLEP